MQKLIPAATGETKVGEKKDAEERAAEGEYFSIFVSLVAILTLH